MAHDGVCGFVLTAICTENGWFESCFGSGGRSSDERGAWGPGDRIGALGPLVEAGKCDLGD